MNRNQLSRILSAFLIVMAMVACVQSGQTAQIPTPGIDSNAISTAVEGTARAAQQTTAVPVQPVATSMAGTTIENLKDGTTKYCDYDGGFEIVFPAGWLTVRANSEEFNAALAKEGKVNSVLHKQMTDDTAGYDPKVDRLYSYILRPDIKKNAMLGAAELEWDSQDSTPLDSAIVGQLVREMESASGLAGFHADTAEFREDSAIKRIEIGGKFTVKNDQGQSVPFHVTYIFFKSTPASTVRMSFVYLQDLYGEISPNVRSIVESIKIIESPQ